MPNFNHLVHSNSWNEWIFEINNHSSCSNEQVLLSFIFSYYNVSRSCYQLLSFKGALRSRESSICLEWVESGCHLPHSFLLRESESEQLNSLDRWPTVVLLLSMLHITTATANLPVNQGHGSQLVTISLIAVKDIHLCKSPQHKLGEISVLSVALTSL